MKTFHPYPPSFSQYIPSSLKTAVLPEVLTTKKSDFVLDEISDFSPETKEFHTLTVV